MRKKSSPIQSYTRLAIGGVFLLLDQLDKIVSEREEMVEKTSQETVDLSTPPSPSEEVLSGVIGIIYEAEDQLLNNLAVLDRFTAWAGRKTNAFIEPVASSRLGRPFADSFNRLALKGEKIWDRWVYLGRSQNVQSKAVAGQVADDTIDIIIDHLAENEEIRELVQSQSAGLASEIMEELRERGVSADNFLEHLVRKVFRMAERDPQVKPSNEVIEMALPLRKIPGRVYRQ